MNRVNAGDRVLDDLASNFKLHVAAEFKELRKRYDVPETYDLGVACTHVEGGYTDIKYRITCGVLTIRRQVSIDTLDSIDKSSRAIRETIMSICRAFAQQYPRCR